MKYTAKRLIKEFSQLLKGKNIISVQVDTDAQLTEIEPKGGFRQYEPTGELDVSIKLRLQKRGTNGA